MSEINAEVVLPTLELRNDIPFFTNKLGFKMDMIYPADDPTTAVFSGYGLRIRIEKGADLAPGKIRILCKEPKEFANGKNLITAPNGTIIEIDALNPPLILPTTKHSFVVRKLADQAPWVIGRAGMHYRDLIPNRLGGSIIASHIRIPDGGPVPDTVHYHTVGFQLIFCYKGWVDLVYEDQGEPFRLFAGNCVIQPPEIRHKVLYASENIEVIEIGVPAEHVTTIDHNMELPNGPPNPKRSFQGQKFVHFKSDEASWKDFRIPGFVSKDTLISHNTKHVAGVEVIKSNGKKARESTHTSDILFNFVMEGTMTLEGEGKEPYSLVPGDAFVIPPIMKTKYTDISSDLELLEVSLPGKFDTHLI